MKLLLASNNPKKRDEILRMLAPLDVQVVVPAEIGGIQDVSEDEPDFRGNAAKKARSAARSSGMWALADDSGLEVDALGGAPGVQSARFAGEHGNDESNNRLLLEKLARVPEAARSARFVCALALARPDGSLAAEIEGSARGRILERARGHRDFGYDPLFLFTEEGYHQTGKSFAELPPEEKAEVSHRGRALRELIRRLSVLRRED